MIPQIKRILYLSDKIETGLRYKRELLISSLILLWTVARRKCFATKCETPLSVGQSV